MTSNTTQLAKAQHAGFQFPLNQDTWIWIVQFAIYIGIVGASLAKLGVPFLFLVFAQVVSAVVGTLGTAIYLGSTSRPAIRWSDLPGPVIAIVGATYIVYSVVW